MSATSAIQVLPIRMQPAFEVRLPASAVYGAHLLQGTARSAACSVTSNSALFVPRSCHSRARCRFTSRPGSRTVRTLDGDCGRPPCGGHGRGQAQGWRYAAGLLSSVQQPVYACCVACGSCHVATWVPVPVLAARTRRSGGSHGCLLTCTLACSATDSAGTSCRCRFPFCWSTVIATAPAPLLLLSCVSARCCACTDVRRHHVRAADRLHARWGVTADAARWYTCVHMADASLYALPRRWICRYSVSGVGAMVC
jgi:hypothetical protein